MKVYIYERGQKEITKLCEELLINCGFIISDRPHGSDIAVAPWLDRLIPAAEIDIYNIGVLIFHPSLLPAYRGKSAIKDAFKNGDTYSGITWFWAAKGYDTGDICAQAVLPITEPSPREFYERKVIPAAVILLRLISDDLKRGRVIKRKQNIFDEVIKTGELQAL